MPHVPLFLQGSLSPGLPDELSPLGLVLIHDGAPDDAPTSEAEADRMFEELMMLEDARRGLADAVVERHPGELAAVYIDGGSGCAACTIHDHDGKVYEGTGASFADAVEAAESQYRLRPFTPLHPVTTPIYRLNTALWAH